LAHGVCLLAIAALMRVTELGKLEGSYG
jgi:hypothetical protein